MNVSGLHTFQVEDRIVIDANVLIYVYCPLSGKDSEIYISHYSNLLQKLSDAKSSVFVNSLIVSEFINRWLRLDHKKSGLSDFKKDYRSSDRYKITMKTIMQQLKKFYKQCNVKNLDDGFSSIDIQNSYTHFPSSDFNDIVIAENVKNNRCKLLTRDHDFSQYGIELIN